MGLEVYQGIGGWVLAAFFSGSIPYGFLVSKILYSKDIRTLGSGNIGFTNVLRSFGWKPALVTFVLDIAKGLLPVLIASERLGATPGEPSSLSQAGALSLVALFAILGHVITPWLGFKGGKGIATGLGVLIGLLGWLVLVPLALFVAAVASTRYVSLGSIVGAVGFLALTLAYVPPRPYWPMGVLLTALVLVTHRDNINRLRSGTERKLGR